MKSADIYTSPVLAAVMMLPSTAFAQTKTDEPIKTTLCELVKVPASYHGRLIQLRAIVNTGFEWSVLQDAACPKETIWLEFEASPNSVFRHPTQYAYIDSADQATRPELLHWNPIPPVTAFILRKDAQFRELARLLGKRAHSRKAVCLDCPLYTVTATLIGGFEHSNGHLRAVKGQDGKITVPPNSFGHMNGWDSQLVVQSVSDVQAQPDP